MPGIRTEQARLESFGNADYVELKLATQHSSRCQQSSSDHRDCAGFWSGRTGINLAARQLSVVGDEVDVNDRAWGKPCVDETSGRGGNLVRTCEKAVLGVNKQRLHRQPTSHSVRTDVYRERLVVRTECICLLYTSPSPRDGLLSRMPS